MAHPNEGKTFIGKIKFFDTRKGKGFGFILCPEATEGGEIFVHLMHVRGEGYKILNPQDKVKFVLAYNEEGQPQAHDVEIVERAPKPNPLEDGIPGQIIARNVEAAISIWNESKRHGFINNLAQFGDNDVFIHPSEIDDDEETIELRQGTRLTFDVQIAINSIGERKLQAINIKIRGAAKPEDIIMKSDVDAMLVRFDSAKRIGFAETDTEPPLRVFINARRLVKHHDETELTKNIKIICDICESREGPYGINIRLAVPNNGRTAMEMAFEAANGDDDDAGGNGKTKGDVSPTEALHAANEDAKTDQKRRSAVTA